MANVLYDKARQSFLEGGIAWLTANVKAVLVNIASGHYTVAPTTDQFLSAIAAGDRVATSPNFASKTSGSPVGGVADAADITFTTVTGAQCGALVLYVDTTNAATSPLICYIDTATGLPVTPNGGDITVAFDNGTNRIFKL